MPQAPARRLPADRDLLRALVDDAPVGVVLLDADSRVTRMNEVLVGILGSSREALLGQVLASSDETRAGHGIAGVASALVGTGGRSLRAEVPLRTGDGRWVHAAVHVTRLRDESGADAGCLVHVLDLTERHMHARDLEHLARHDPLTGLLNRHGFRERLDEHVALCGRYGGTGALLLLDLDDFRAVNDALGPTGGDGVLVSTAEVLRDRLRATDLTGRLGGDEFAVLLPRAVVDEAEVVAHALRHAVADRVSAAGVQGRPWRVTVRVGVAAVHVDRLGADALLADAGLAVQEAKTPGASGVVVASDVGGAPPPGSRTA